jgi:hypothetical protein
LPLDSARGRVVRWLFDANSHSRRCVTAVLPAAYASWKADGLQLGCVSCGRV